MPDRFIFCQRNQEQEQNPQEFIHIHRLILQIATKQDLRIVSLYNARKDFVNKHKDFLEEFVQIENQPALIRLVDIAKGYYWNQFIFQYFRIQNFINMKNFIRSFFLNYT